MTHSTTKFLGLDLSDRKANFCIIDQHKKVLQTGVIKVSPADLHEFFANQEPMTILCEASTSTPWISRNLTNLGHHVIVAHPRNLGYVTKALNKNDANDANKLAQIAASGLHMVTPVQHRSEQNAQLRNRLTSRDLLVNQRTSLINFIRSTCKSVGKQLPSCSAEAFFKKALSEIPAELKTATDPLFITMKTLNEQIKILDQKIRELAEQDERSKRLMTVPGVGPITSVAFVAMVDDPARFPKNRDVGAYFGIVPRQAQSGSKDPRLPITRCGDAMVRRLLVSCAHYVLGPFCEDSALRQWGLQVAARQGKKKAVCAVARKLAVVLLSMWKSGEDWQAFPGGAQG